MLTLQRRELVAFRTILRRCRPTRSTETAPVVRIDVAKGTLRFLCTTAGVTLGYMGAGSKRDTEDELDWCLPASVLDLA